MKEYLRRNLTVCKAIGAQAAARNGLQRERKRAHPRKWVIRQFEAIDCRLDDVVRDLVSYRDQVKP